MPAPARAIAVLGVRVWLSSAGSLVCDAGVYGWWVREVLAEGAGSAGWLGLLVCGVWVGAGLAEPGVGLSSVWSGVLSCGRGSSAGGVAVVGSWRFCPG
ncbi:hypothetical protein SANTM175S_03311 [Streptomyces antimycoticus]